MVATEAPRATVEEVARGYLASLRKRVARGTITAYSVQRNERNYELHLSEAFAATPYADLEPEDVESWLRGEVDPQLARTPFLHHESRASAHAIAGGQSV